MKELTTFQFAEERSIWPNVGDSSELVEPATRREALHDIDEEYPMMPPAANAGPAWTHSGPECLDVSLRDSGFRDIFDQSRIMGILRAAQYSQHCPGRFQGRSLKIQGDSVIGCGESKEYSCEFS